MSQRSVAPGPRDGVLRVFWYLQRGPMTSPDCTEPPSSLPLGSVLAGKYRLEAILGVGGMATVFAATHRNGGRFAIKILHSRYASDRGMRARFLREGYAANRVGHPGALRVHDDDVTGEDVVFLVLELLDGETVGRRASRSGQMLSPTEALSVAYQTLDVLGAAHGKGIIHRDIKPENLFVSRTGVLTVLDFGIARLLEVNADAGATQTGMTLGTPAFMAPEQALGHVAQVGARTDLWALGATLFYLLTGRFVHRGSTPQEIAAYAATRPAPRLGVVAPELHAELCALVDGALEFAPQDRFADAEAMKAAVVRAYRATAEGTLDTASAASALAFNPTHDVSWGASGSTEVMRDPARSTAGATADPSLMSITPARKRARRLMTILVTSAAATLIALAVVMTRSAVRARSGAVTAKASASLAPSGVGLVDDARATPIVTSDSGQLAVPEPSVLPLPTLAPALPPVPLAPSVTAARRIAPPPRSSVAKPPPSRVDAGAPSVEDLYKP